MLLKNGSNEYNAWDSDTSLHNRNSVDALMQTTKAFQESPRFEVKYAFSNAYSCALLL